MALLSRPSRQQPGTGSRTMAMLALLLLLCLGGWRLNSMLHTQTGQSLQTPLDATLTGLVEPIAGAGNIRVSVNQNAAGQKSALVVVNTLSHDAVAQIEPLKRIVLTGASIDLAAGDTVVIEQVPFAKSMSGGLSTDNLIEMGVFVALLGLLAMVAVKSEAADTPAPQTELSSQVRKQSDDIDSDTATAPAPKRAPDSDLVTTVNNDPAAAADVLRGWMRGTA